MSGLRIALVGETGGPGGAERMMLHLAGELRRRGHDVHPVGPADRSPWLRMQFREGGFEPLTYTMRGRLDPSLIARMTSLFRQIRADIVHTHEFLTSVYGGVAARLLSRPHVITMHGGRYYAERAHRRLALRWTAQHSRALVAVSEATAGELAQSLRLAPAAVRVIYNGISYKPGDRAAVRRELSVGEDEVLVAAVGNLYAVKGHIVLLRALARLEEAGAELPRWRVVIAGRGAEEASLRDFANGRGWAERVHLLGFREDAANVIAAADVFAMPSLSEGLPLALIEAMFAGRAIVASRTGGIPEVVADGAEALLAAPGNDADLAERLRAVLVSPELRTRLGEGARRRAAFRLTVERMADEYERIYHASTTKPHAT